MTSVLWRGLDIWACRRYVSVSVSVSVNVSVCAEVCYGGAWTFGPVGGVSLSELVSV